MLYPIELLRHTAAYRAARRTACMLPSQTRFVMQHGKDFALLSRWKTQLQRSCILQYSTALGSAGCNIKLP